MARELIIHEKINYRSHYDTTSTPMYKSRMYRTINLEKDSSIIQVGKWFTSKITQPYFDENVSPDIKLNKYERFKNKF